MKAAAVALVLTLLAAPVGAVGSPIAKVIEMVSDLETKVIGEGEDAHKVYAEFAEFCEDKSKELQFEIKTGKSEVEELTATIDEENTKITTLTAKIEDLGAELANGEGDLKAATKVRKTEAADFAAEEKELTETIDMLERAIGILERELAKSGGASMLQVKNAAKLTDALNIMVKVGAFAIEDKDRLTALIQSNQAAAQAQQSQDSDSDSDSDPGAPAGAVYEGSSGNIVETCQGLLDKAESQLDAARKEETTAQNNYDLLKQSVDDAMKNNKKDMEEAKKDMAEAGKKKSEAEGDLAVTSKDLNNDIAELEELHHNCMTKASDYEAGVKEREEELKALATAKKIIKEATSLAQENGQASFLQISEKSQEHGNHAARFVRDLATKLKTPELAQLAKRMQSAYRFGAMAGEDPFAKVKGLITDMIAKLEKSAEADATQKAWCDKEMSETTEKKEDKEGEIEALTTNIDEMSAQSAKLKEEIATLQKELAELAASQKEMDEIRAKEKALYDKAQPETAKGLEGIKNALKVLTDYYSGKDSGAGEGIISMLEVCESDFSKALADIESTEASAVQEYEAQTKENEITKTAKDQDVKYKTKESTGLDKAVAEATADREGVQNELDAVDEYFAKIKDKCIAKPETYEEIKRRRDAEIKGCKEALAILEGEAAFLIQRSASHLRGRVVAHSA